MKQDSPMPEPGAHTDSQQATTEQPAPDAPATSQETLQPGVLDERVLLALEAASDKKALNPQVLDLRELASFTDLFVIVSGTNARQVQAIADGVVERLKEAGTRAARVEGYNSAEWVLLDYGDFIFHIFEEKARRFYDLERLWRDAQRVTLPPEFTDGGNSSLTREQ